MNKAELISVLSQKTDKQKIEIEKYFKYFCWSNSFWSKKGKKVTIPGLGAFTKLEQAARLGINPSSGEKIQISARSIPKFKAAKAFKDFVA